jgi:hypothetical protein
MPLPTNYVTMTNDDGRSILVSDRNTARMAALESNGYKREDGIVTSDQSGPQPLDDGDYSFHEYENGTVLGWRGWLTDGSGETVGYRNNEGDWRADSLNPDDIDCPQPRLDWPNGRFEIDANGNRLNDGGQ